MSILLFLVVLSGLVLIHEAGHFLAAKWSGVKPEEFGIGFPPRALGWTKGKDGRWRRVKRGEETADGTIWSLNWLPLGGFVRLKGEQGEDAASKDSFIQASWGRKLAVISAGVVMNWLLAATIFTVGGWVGVPMDGTSVPPGAVVRERYVEVTQVLPDGPAARAGLKPGDRLVGGNGEAAGSAEAYRVQLRERAARQELVSVTVLRNGNERTFSIRPEPVAALGARGIGISFADTAVVRLPWWRAPLEGARLAGIFTVRIVQGLYGLLHDLVVRHRVAQEVSGPIGIAVMTGQVARQGGWAVFQFVAMLSLNLAVVNFLPIPGLDGGRALFLVVEALRRKRLDHRLEAAIHGAGFVALLLLILLVTVQDLGHYGPRIWGKLVSLL